MVIKNRKGEITSYPTWAIMEPNSKYLDSQSFCTSSNFGIYREYWCRRREVIRSKEFAKKKDP